MRSTRSSAPARACGLTLLGVVVSACLVPVLHAQALPDSGAAPGAASELAIPRVPERASPATIPYATMPATQPHRRPDDRLQHASLAFSSGLAAGLLTEEPAAAAGAALALGLAKELLDARRTGFDRGDLAADLLGAALAALVTRAITR